MMENKISLLILGIFLISLASAIQIDCSYSGERGEEGGLKVWSNLNISESILIEEIFRGDLTEEQLNSANCSISSETNLTEMECKRYFAPVINILNSNIDKRNKIIRKQKIFLIGSIIIFVLLFLREIYLWKKK